MDVKIIFIAIRELNQNFQIPATKIKITVFSTKKKKKSKSKLPQLREYATF